MPGTPARTLAMNRKSLYSAALSGAEFDYSIFPASVAKRLREKAEQIASLKPHAVMIAGEFGRLLLSARSEMDRGTFLLWVEGPAGMSKSVAYRLMDMVRVFGDELPVLGSLPVTTVQRLAEKSVPATLRESILRRAKSGEALRSKAILLEIDEARATERARPKEVREAQGRKKLTSAQDAYEDAQDATVTTKNSVSDRLQDNEITRSAIDLIKMFGADDLAKFFDQHGSAAWKVFHRAIEIVSDCDIGFQQTIDVPRADIDRDGGCLDPYLGDANADDAVLDIAERIMIGEAIDPATAVKIDEGKYIVIRGDKTFRAFADVLNRTDVPVNVVEFSKIARKYDLEQQNLER